MIKTLILIRLPIYITITFKLSHIFVICHSQWNNILSSSFIPLITAEHKYEDKNYAKNISFSKWSNHTLILNCGCTFIVLLWNIKLCNKSNFQLDILFRNLCMQVSFGQISKTIKCRFIYRTPHCPSQEIH